MTKKADNSYTKGTLILKQIEFDRVFYRKVMGNNSTSGKVTLPKDLVGREVYVVVKEQKKIVRCCAEHKQRSGKT